MTFPSTAISSPPQVQAEVLVNEAFETLEHGAVYGKRHEASAGLTWGYYGGRFGGTAIADGTLALAASSTNYITVNRSTGAIGVSTSSADWDNVASYARVYKVTTSAGAPTSVEDHRAGPNGVHGVPSAISPIGRHSVWISAMAMQPQQTTGGCSSLTAVAGATNQPDLAVLLFDATSIEYAQFALAMPKSWDEGTVTFQPVWRHGATATNYGVVWGVQGVSVPDGASIASYFGTAQTSSDTGGTTGTLYKGPESSAITIAGAGGSPAAAASESVVFFRVYRDPTSGSDTLAIDAALLGIVLHINTTATTDA